MKDKFYINISKGKYSEVEKLCKNMSISDIKDIIMMIAYDTESICVYSFIQYMIQKTEKLEYIELAIDIMLHPFCFLEGAYSIALFHSRELLAITKKIENLERILFFHSIPEKLVDDKEAKYIIKEILKIDPNNKVALELKY